MYRLCDVSGVNVVVIGNMAIVVFDVFQIVEQSACREMELRDQVPFLSIAAKKKMIQKVLLHIV